MSDKDEKLARIARDFQSSMVGLGLGVTISVPGEKPFVVTEVCPDCEGDRLRKKSCVKCGGKGALA